MWIPCCDDASKPQSWWCSFASPQLPDTLTTICPGSHHNHLADGIVYSLITLYDTGPFRPSTIQADKFYFPYLWGLNESNLTHSTIPRVFQRITHHSAPLSASYCWCFLCIELVPSWHRSFSSRFTAKWWRILWGFYQPPQEATLSSRTLVFCAHLSFVACQICLKSLAINHVKRNCSLDHSIIELILSWTNSIQYPKSQ